MIKINGDIIEMNHFPDGSQRLMNINLDNKFTPQITWFYENDEEMVTLYYLVSHIRNTFPEFRPEIALCLYYIPNARMDRVKSENEIFTLKYFCDFINSLNFHYVLVFDPHSHVSEALINNIKYVKIENIFTILMSYLNDNEIDLIYFPDNGAMKRYGDMITKYFDYELCYGNKVRDWKTGKIEGLEVYYQNGEKCENNSLEGKNILMIDDIISYGGTMYHSAKKLKEMGANKISIYTSHLENSFFDKEKGALNKIVKNTTNNNNIIDYIYTTNSIYNEKNNTENYNIKLITKF